ncbi:MAG: ISL3 family transposase [bacterium]|nr:ISL3 family transposase [bacterium]
MHLKTILNYTLNFKSFVFKKCTLVNSVIPPRINIEIVARKGSKGICSVCNEKAPTYDTLAVRSFEHIPMWGILTFFLYAPRRVKCPRCGIKVELLPWGNGKRPLTNQYASFLSHWAKRLSWKEVAEAFHTSWHKVFISCRLAVEWGRKNMSLNDIHSIGIDEVLWHRGKKFLTVVYQIDSHRKRLLWICVGRTKASVKGFFKWLGEEKTNDIKYVCSDMLRSYLKAVEDKVPQAIHVLDRFHTVQMIQKAIQKVRAEEARKLKAEGKKPLLKKTRWVILKKPENLTQKQGERLEELLKQNLKTVKCYLLKEDFKRLWDYKSSYWAGKFIDRWTKKVMYSRIEPLKKVARTIREHKPLILNYFKAKKTISQGVVEGFNNKLKLTFKRSYGFRTFEATEIQLYHTLGDLPCPKVTHKFF